LYVTENARTQQGLTWDNVRWAFTTFESSNWQPLAWLSHMLDVELFGLWAGGHHLTNVLLHALNTALLFYVLWRMTGALWPSAFCAAVFAVHPLHVESVAWVSQRKDVLSTLFWLLAMLAYRRYVLKPGAVRYALVAACLLLGLMAKAMLVTLPCVLLLLDYWPLRRIWPSRGDENRGRWRCLGSGWRPGLPVILSEAKDLMGGSSVAGVDETLRCAQSDQRGESGDQRGESGDGWRRAGWLVLEKAPLLGIAAAVSIATYVAQDTGGAVNTFEILPLGMRIRNAFTSYLNYLADTFWPANLAIFYPHPRDTLSWGEAALAAGLLVAVTVAVLLLARRARYLPAGWFWYLGTLVPVIGIIQVGTQARADRYMYVPLIGLSIMVAWGLRDAVGRWKAGRAALWAGAVASVAVMTVLAFQQAAVWRDTVSLFGHAADVVPDNARAHAKLGFILYDQGRFDEAMHHLHEALRIQPGNHDARRAIAKVHTARGEYPQAMDVLREGLEMDPYDPALHNAVGTTLVAMEEFDRARMAFNMALQLDPRMTQAADNLAVTDMMEGNYDAAERYFQRHLALRPNDPDLLNNMGLTLAKQGRIQDAAPYFRQALQANPNYGPARANLERYGLTP
jgi:Flp pilus assembly protein TadD